ncbi:hypothetical protein NE237_027346 [Protea cynaroides]|uniref:6-phosphogluconate dehydrogenase NADP-binding domain-containing protein n=1 Tax=Protea cynaroides TaxID=273540 RepID=A0A9Q0GRP5_9MAGN|nr:hypothetical protein NE237_027346 [Protea cynaroides]
MAATITTLEPISLANIQLGWIETGVMGQSMCSHLIKAGYSLTVFNRTQSRVQPLLDMGAHYAFSPQEVAAHSNVVFSIVDYPSDDQFVLIGSFGALQGLLPDSIPVDMTTSDPSLAVELKMGEQSRAVAERFVLIRLSEIYVD